MLTILANVKIDTPKKLKHWQDSFLSFCTISDDWLLNVQGALRNEAFNFVRERLPKNALTEFDLSNNDKNRWSSNSLIMLKSARYDYVLLWNEDHINLAPQPIYVKIISEMEKYKTDLLCYSWWYNGYQSELFEPYKNQRGEVVDVVYFTPKILKDLLNTGFRGNIISKVCIFHRDLLHRMLRDDIRRFPHIVTRVFYKLFHMPKLLGIRIKEVDYYNFFKKFVHYICRDLLPLFPLDTPFNIGKDFLHTNFLPLTIAIPKQELFASIDKDNEVAGYSLLKRGSYGSPSGHTPSLSSSEIVEVILHEVQRVLSALKDAQVKELVDLILTSKNIVLCGAGRVGLASRAFTMRLAHLGLNAFFVGDVNVPAVSKDDLFIVASGSGETQTIFDLLKIAKEHGAKTALITGNPDSRMGKLSDVIVEILAPSKVKKIEGFSSIQPMTTLNEQCLWIFFDSLVLRLMDETQKGHDEMWKLHSVLE
jgi:6-phospho-3-hexuloisomerase